MESTNPAVEGNGEALVPGLERAIVSGRLAVEVIDQSVLNGAGDLMVALIELSRERFLTPGERLRESGRRAGERIVGRLQERLHERFGLESLADLPWAMFTRLVSQLSNRLGFGELEMRTDEDSGVVNVIVWSSPFPEVFGSDEPICVMIEGFAVSLLEAVSRTSLEAVESPEKIAGGEVYEFVVGPQTVIRRFLGGKVAK